MLGLVFSFFGRGDAELTFRTKSPTDSIAE